MGFNVLVLPVFIDASITGFESPAAEFKDLDLSLDSLLISHPSATFIGIASGPSMQSSGIFDGDILIADRSVIPKTGDVIVGVFDNSYVCKIIDLKKRVLISTSPIYRETTITADCNFKIEAVVTSSVRLHRSNRELVRCMR